MCTMSWDKHKTDPDERELAELLAEEELADQEVERFIASMQQAEAEGEAGNGRPAAPVMVHEAETPFPLVTPAPCSPTKPDEGVVTEYQLRMIRRKLYEFFMVKKELPTCDKLTRLLKREFNITLGRKVLHKVLRGDGYRLGGRQELIRMPHHAEARLFFSPPSEEKPPEKPL